MDQHSGQTISLWMATQTLPRFEPLNRHVAADVCIVGAGIAGLTTAYLLGLEGRKVVVLDDGPIVSGQTERTTAHLASANDDHFVELERLHGHRGAWLAAQSHAAAIDCIERITVREGIACDFQRLDGYLFEPEGKTSDLLERELAAAHRAGLIDAEIVPRAPIPGFDTGRALRFPRQGQFHPLAYLDALAKAIVRDGGRIFAHTHAAALNGGETVRVETSDGYTVNASALVVATNTPVNDRVTMHTKQAPYRTYVIAGGVPTGAVPQALYWDTLDPYHYVRLQVEKNPADGTAREMLIVGGEDHKTGQASDPQERFSRLEAWTRQRFPIQEVKYRWSGQVMEPVDFLAFIGRNPGREDNVYIATGDSGQGMTHGTIAGLLLTDLICGRENPWRDLYDPARRTLRSAAEFARENLNVAAQYKDYLTGGEVREVEQVAPGTGAILRRGARKLAVYCDDSGERHVFSAVCPHLGCVVAWNSLERSWDCPCHGSRFSCLGEVVDGPANSNLKRVDEPAHGESGRHAA